jgi:hypothetical protein
MARMRFDDDEMNIRPELAEALGYAPHYRRREAQASALVHRGGVAGRIIRRIFAIGAGFVLLAFIGWLVAPERGPAIRTAAAAPASPHAAPSRKRHPNSQRAKHAQPEGASPAFGEYLPDEYSIGRLSMPIWIVDRMPHPSLGVPDANFLALMPEGTDVLFERQNVDGWRRTVSYDGRYVGYAQIFPTVPYAPQPMQLVFAKLIPMLRRIP